MAQEPDLPLVRVESVADGSTTQFAIPFPFLERDYVYATVDGVPVDFEWLNDSFIIIDPPPPEGAVVMRYRSTFSEHARHIFQSGVPFRPRYIDENNTQLFNVMQESVAWAQRAVDLATQALRVSQEADNTANEALGTAQLAVQIAMEARDLAQAALEAALGYTQVVTITQDTLLDTSYGGMWVRAEVPTGEVITCTIPRHTVSQEFTPAEIIVSVVGGGTVVFEEGDGVSIVRMHGTGALIQGTGAVAALKQTAEGEWALYGALEDL